MKFVLRSFKSAVFPFARPVQQLCFGSWLFEHSFLHPDKSMNAACSGNVRRKECGCIPALWCLPFSRATIPRGADSQAVCSSHSSARQSFLVGKGNSYSFQVLTWFLVLAVQQNDDPTQEQIDKLHAQFTAALKKLFDDNKHILGPVWAKKQLNVI